ncbi:MAG: M48 family metallopeptidase [Chitinophagales bacterium]
MKKILPLFILLLFLGLGAAAQGTDSLKQVAQSFNVDSATEQWLNTLNGPARAKSDAYFEGGYWLLLWNTLYALLVAALFMFTGLSARIKKAVSRFKSQNIQNLLYAAAYILLSYLLTFPLNVYQSYFREHQYGLSNMSFTGWLSDELTGLAVAIIGGSLILMVLYIAIRKTGKNWWAWGAGITVAFSALVLFIMPVFLMPLFNKYEPLQDGQLKQEILSMARANSIPAQNVYQFDASKQSDRISANVSGIASTTRISLNDNLLKRCTPAEIKSVMGHEMGHYVMNHIYKGLLQMGVLIVIVFGLANYLFEKTKNKWGQRLQITAVSDISTLPVLAGIFSLVMFFTTPLTNTMTRTMEAEADMFGLNAAREPDAEAHVDMMLSEYRKIDPGYWEEILFYDHPSGRNRVHMAMQWKAEHLNELK